MENTRLKYLHISRLWSLIEKTDSDGKPIPFNIKFVKKTTGEIVSKKVVCTSVHSTGSTINIKDLEKNKVQKIRKCLILQYNDYKIIM